MVAVGVRRENDMRLIDADELIYLSFDGGIEFVPSEFIKEAPTVPAVVPVRCGECVDDGNCPAQHYIGFSSVSYCSAGERKQGR